MNKRVMGGVLAGLGLALLPAMATPAAATQEFQHTQDSKVLATTLELYTDYKYDTNWLHGGLVRYYTSSSIRECGTRAREWGTRGAARVFGASPTLTGPSSTRFIRR